MISLIIIIIKKIKLNFIILIIRYLSIEVLLKASIFMLIISIFFIIFSYFLAIFIQNHHHLIQNLIKQHFNHE